MRKKRGSPLDLSTHINQYVRCYSSPSVPQIKIEPSNYLDVNLDLDRDEEEELDEEYENEEEEEDLDEEEEDDSEEEFKPNADSLRGTSNLTFMDAFLKCQFVSDKSNTHDDRTFHLLLRDIYNLTLTKIKCSFENYDCWLSFLLNSPI